MITTAHVYTWLFIHLGVFLVAAAYYAVGAAVLPRLTARSEARFARRPWLPALVGVAVSVPWVVIGIALLPGGGPKALVGAILLGLWMVAGLVGGAGMAQHIGRLGSAPTGWCTVARGGLLIALTWALPIVGWVVMLPLSLATGLGCLVLGPFGRGQSVPLEAVAAAPGAMV
ncbi:MAG: hypothetical protein KDA22_16470 [Phycisphaerales bacterium]|nr:hypothetical protein [Phycisphaerales bacterium]